MHQQWLLKKLCLACTLLALWSGWTQQALAVTLNGYLLPARINGAFTLTDQNGQSFSSEQLGGRYTLLLFGYTSCPDVCPMTLHQGLQIKEALQRELPLQVVLITLDPERDTPEKLGQYVAAFSKDILALSGDQKTIANIAQRYRVKYRKKPANRAGNYSIDHSTYIYLLDKKSRPLVFYPYGAAIDDIISDLRKLNQHGQSVVVGRIWNRPGMMEH